MGGMNGRLRRLEARAPAARAEEEVRAEACRRTSSEDLETLSDLGGRLERRLQDDRAGIESVEEAGRVELTADERAAFEYAYGRYQEAVKEVRAER